MDDFNDSRFSKDLKIQKLNFLEGGDVDESLIENHLIRLSKHPIGELSTDPQKIAFWINVYNGLTNTLIIQRKIRKSMMTNPTVFFIPKFDVGGYQFSLDDIEHGILRKNVRAPYKPWGQFSSWDKRKQFLVEKVDYRIHFALNCGAKSCPPIAFYSVEYLEKELAMAEESFNAQYWLVDEEKKEIQCSLIHKSYKNDFGDKYLNDKRYQGFKVKLLKYDWGVV